MSDWNIGALAELAEVLDSHRVPVREEERPPGTVPYYGANGQQGWIDRPLFNEPLILLAEDGGHFDDYAHRPIAYRIEGPSWVNNHAHVLRAARGVDHGFLFWALRNKDIRHWIAGGTRAKLTRGELEQVTIDVPPLEEQRRIAEILDSIDETIQATERVIAKRRTALRGLQQHLCGELGAPVVPVSELVSKEWPGEWGAEAAADGLAEVHVLRATNLADHSVDFSTAARRFVPEAKARSKRLANGDLILEGAGGGPGVPVGRVARFTQGNSGVTYLTSNFFRALRPASEVNPDYLYWLLDHEYRKPSIWSCQQQTTGIINLKLQDYLARSVSFECDRQAEIANALDTALGAIDADVAARAKLRETRAGLAADLLSGRVRTVAA